MKRVRVLVVAVLALAACEGGEIFSADLSVGSTCTGTLTGAVSEKITSCRVTWDEMSGVADIGNAGDIVVSDPTAIDDTGANFGFVLTVNGDYRAGVLSFANVTMAAAGVFVRTDGGQHQFAANFPGSAPMAPPTIGSLDANLTAAEVDVMNATERRWIVHGHVNATLVRPPPSTSPEHVMMSLDF
jgi:hypothetical protein